MSELIDFTMARLNEYREGKNGRDRRMVETLMMLATDAGMELEDDADDEKAKWTLLVIACEFPDHPDYHDEWRPDDASPQ